MKAIEKKQQHHAPRMMLLLVFYEEDGVGFFNAERPSEPMYL
jgi:hypothetical protein